MVRWKIAIYVGIGAFSLSFLLGIISSNPFFIILLRAIIFGLVFMAIGAASTFIINKYIPELFNPDYKSIKEANEGENINIIIPEENSVLTESLVEKTEALNNDLNEEDEEIGMTEELETADETENKDLINEVEEIKENYKEMKKPGDDVIAEEVYPDEETEAIESEKIDNGEEFQEKPIQDKTEDKTEEKTKAEEELDKLPDMGVLENSFLVLDNVGSSENNPLSDVKLKIKDKLPKKEDPAVYAQALRTIIKRDEEGPKKYGR